MIRSGPVPAWVSRLAEECAQLAAVGDGGGITRRIADASTLHGWQPWELTQVVAMEWDRLGIIRVPGALRSGGQVLG